MSSRGSRATPEVSTTLLDSSEATFDFGKQLVATLPEGSVVALFGELGAGKTTLIKGLASGATGLDPREVSSPTFTYLHIYPGKREVYHFDLYRLKGEREFSAKGFEEYLHLPEGIVCIEWAERIPALLPTGALILEMEHRGETLRAVTRKRAS